jgi:hypothetical protein
VVSAAALCVQEIERELGSSSVQDGRKEVRGKHGSTLLCQNLITRKNTNRFAI